MPCLFICLFVYPLLRLLEVNVYFTLKAINLQTVQHHELPDCYDFSIVVRPCDWNIPLTTFSLSLSLLPLFIGFVCRKENDREFSITINNTNTSSFTFLIFPLITNRTAPNNIKLSLSLSPSLSRSHGNKPLFTPRSPSTTAPTAAASEWTWTTTWTSTSVETGKSREPVSVVSHDSRLSQGHSFFLNADSHVPSVSHTAKARPSARLFNTSGSDAAAVRGRSSIRSEHFSVFFRALCTYTRFEAPPPGPIGL